MEEKQLFTIRVAEPSDAAEILGIYAPYVTDTAVTFEYTVPACSEMENRISQVLDRYPYLVAESDHRILGYAYAGAFKGRAAYDWAVETSVYVGRESRKTGIGRALYERLEDCLHKQGILNMNACIAYADEEDAFLTADSVRFHEKMGFQMIGKFHECGYKFGRWYHMVWMEKIIGDHLAEQPEVIPFAEIKNINEFRKCSS